MKKILVLYYSQSGQLKNIVDSVCKPFIDSSDYQVDIVRYRPQNDYSFPWSSDDFFNAFPESRKGIPCAMQDLPLERDARYDLIIFAYQVWYLSPSIPAISILQDPKLQGILTDTPVVTLLGVRNMWIQAHQVIHQKLLDIKAYHVGNIVLTDPSHNLTSVVSFIRWLIKGQQEKKGIFPRAGVPIEKIDNAHIYGTLIKTAIDKQDFKDLQSHIFKNRGVKVDFVLKTLEKNGFRIFGIWANFILKKGDKTTTQRLFRVRMFKNYLLFIIFALSPIASLIFRIISWVFYPTIRRNMKKIALMQ